VCVHREVVFGCEMLGLDPLEMANEGKMLLVVAPEAERSVLECLRAHPLGREAAAIGEIQPSPDQCGVVLIAGEVDTVHHWREGESLPRLC
jgi:hydrogenase expression/formation protein HypE